MGVEIEFTQLRTISKIKSSVVLKFLSANAEYVTGHVNEHEMW